MVEKIAVLDFETFAIKARPDYPPKPVGLAYFLPQPGKPVGLKDYLPCRSPSERQKVKGIIKDLARDGYRFLMHNASFDLGFLNAARLATAGGVFDQPHA